MFKDNDQIIKIHGSDRFISVKEAFGIGKVKIEFRVYDKSKDKGSKTKQSIDIYLDIDKFAVMSRYLADGRIMSMIEDSERKSELKAVNELLLATKTKEKDILTYYNTYSVNAMDLMMLQDLKQKLIAKAAKNGIQTGNYQNIDSGAVFENYGGSTKDNVITSRIIQIKKGLKYPLLFVASEGPGYLGKNNQIVPNYKEWKSGRFQRIMIPLSEESVTMMGLAGLRAIAIYDLWSSMGILDTQLKRISYQDQQPVNDNAQRSAPVENPYGEQVAQPAVAQPVSGIANGMQKRGRITRAYGSRPVVF